MSWSTTRCTRCLDPIMPGVVHRCSSNRAELRTPHCRFCGSLTPQGVVHVCTGETEPSDPDTLRAMAERWRPRDQHMAVIGERVVSELLNELADAMEEAE